jgi:hypothetical protein
MEKKPQRLNRSVRSGNQKSCPKCSVREGQFVFYPLKQFGVRNNGGVEMLQSWCNSCRGYPED